MNQKASPDPRLVLTALIIVQILFGLNYVISKIVVGAFPPLVWASIRIIIAASVMVGVALLSGRKHPKVGKEFFVPLIFYASLGTIINQGCFLVGLRHTTSTNSAILNTLIPVFTLLVVTARKQEPLTLNRLIGFVLAFAGVLVVRKVENFSLSDQTMVGDLLTILNCFSYALFLSFSKKFMEKNDPLWTTAWLFIYGSVGLTLLALPEYQNFKMPQMTNELWWAAVYAVLGATLATYFLNFWALAHAKSSQVALYIYMQPVVAALLAWGYYGEKITLRTGLACMLIFAGMLMAIKKKSAPAMNISLPSISSAKSDSQSNSLDQLKKRA